MPPEPTRRALLASLGAAAALSGCTSADTGTDGGTSDAPPSGTSATPPPSPGDGPGGDRPTATDRDPDPLAVAGAWPQRGADPGRSGVVPAPGVPETGRPYWRARRIRSGPPVAGDGYLYHYGKLGASADRVTLTRTRTAPGTAHHVAGDPHLVARRASDGTVAWTWPLDGPGVGWPAVAEDGGGDDGRVVVAVNDQLAALSTGGAVRWNHAFDDVILGDPVLAGDCVVVARQGVVSGEGDETLQQGQVRVYGLADGRERWRVDTPERANGVAVAGDTVVLASAGYDGTGLVIGLALADGSERWRRRVPGDFFRGPVARGDTALVADSEGGVHARSLADGSERWSRTFQGRAGGLAVGDDTVYVAGEELVALARADGSERWRTAGDDDHEGFVTPAVGDRTVYTGTRGGASGRFIALDAGEGTERWGHDLPSKTIHGDVVSAGPEAQPTVLDGAVYAYAVDGLYAFGPDE